jgi:hypothetical protein
VGEGGEGRSFEPEGKEVYAPEIESGIFCTFEFGEQQLYNTAFTGHKNTYISDKDLIYAV